MVSNGALKGLFLPAKVTKHFRLLSRLVGSESCCFFAENLLFSKSDSDIELLPSPFIYRKQCFVFPLISDVGLISLHLKREPRGST